MTFEEWAAKVPDQMRGDSVWRIEAYRLGLFASDLAMNDADKLLKERRTASISDQLMRAAGAVSSDIVEGYSRNTGRDREVLRVRFGIGSRVARLVFQGAFRAG